MIPELNQSGVLPPFIPGQGPTDPAGMAPYKTTISEFVLRYAHSPERRRILRGLLDYRKKLREIGISSGVQWLDGSFVENVELNRGRPPADVDIVTFAFRPTDDFEQWKKLVSGNKDLFLPNEAKQKYFCDAYFVDLNTHPLHVVSNTRYWFGLFSHQRESCLWKGMVEVPIVCGDNEASEILDREAGNA
ncbi:DUF6932 family protein [Marinobacter nauticus]|uniref:DUF6932 family protein n=1 Tax=Marinobacter nauticus TaxID=2743 RepID=UPI00384C897E